MPNPARRPLETDTNTDHPTPSDHELLLRTAQGHSAAAQELWSRHGRRLAAYAAAMLRVPGADASNPAALDAVQSVFVRVLEMNRHTLEQVENVHAWLTTSVRNSVLNMVRGGARREAMQLRLVRTKREESRGRGAAVREDASGDLLQALDRLPEEARELLLLKHVARLTLDQIALSLNENRNTIASRVQAAMERLREALAASESDVEPRGAPVGSLSRTGPVRS